MKSLSNNESSGALPTSLYYLWHLQAVHLLTLQDPGKTMPEAWEGSAEVRVAIIDTGCSPVHPNLHRNIVAQIDFSSHQQGTLYSKSPALENRIDIMNYKDSAEIDWLRTELSSAEKPLFESVLEELADGPQMCETDDPAHIYAAHGTACAGLVAGHKPDTSRNGELNYYGVNPDAKILSIGTPYSYEIRPLIKAVLYAIVNGADVILLPRAVYNPRAERNRKSSKRDARCSRLLRDKTLVKEQKLFESLLSIVCKETPVVLAAGNGGFDELEYPASLVTRKSGKWSDLIVVGAHNSFGVASGYSSGNKDVTVFAPSDDLQPYASNSSSPFGVLTVDLLDEYGYESHGGIGLSADHNEAELQDKRNNPDAMYSSFGGTSAASSIIAGVVSLMQKTNKITHGIDARISGGEVKEYILLNMTDPALECTSDGDLVKTVHVNNVCRSVQNS